MGISPVNDAGVDRYWQPPLPAQQPPVQPAPLSPLGPYRLEPSYHPQLAAQPPVSTPTTQNPGGPYALPPGSTLADTVGGTQAQPFDVTMSQLATAVYGTRGDPPPGWSAVSDQDLSARGIQDPQAWRLQFLGANDTVATNSQEYRAEIYQDGNGNFVLSYRGTAEGMDDWMNNFEQGTGFKTDAADKFSETAVNTATEFAAVFGQAGADGNAGNLAITGHSQGGGLATVGSLATGIPAVTFDASGIHPNTLERMGFADPQKARDIAEGGQIRAYSLDSDLLTQTQEGGPLGLLAPDALGTKIVVEPGPITAHTLAGRAATVEFPDLPPAAIAALNTVAEAARHSPVPLINGVGDLAYSALSHNPNVLTAAMIERQPWQPGYENPSDFGKDLQNLVPDPLKDDFAINTHDLISDIGGVIDSDFKNGDYVQGGFSIAGDLGEGIWNSVGDTANRGTEAAARTIEQHVDGPLGDLLAGAVSGTGDLAQVTADVAGQGVEILADGAGAVVQKGVDVVGWLTGH
jgi:hypothetical protein